MFHGLLGNATEMTVEDARAEVADVLIEGEVVETAFLIIRDMMVFTPKRLILVDKQGLTGKKVEYLSIPWSSIIAFATETAGSWDLDSELKIWVKGQSAPTIKRFKKGSNILAVQQTLARYVLK